jgi:hypothetical protein
MVSCRPTVGPQLTTTGGRGGCVSRRDLSLTLIPLQSAGEN